MILSVLIVRSSLGTFAARCGDLRNRDTREKPNNDPQRLSHAEFRSWRDRRRAARQRRALRRRRDRAARRRDRPANEFPRELWPKLGALGLHGITVEEEYGGSGLGYLEHCVAMEEISRALGLGRALLRRAFQPLRQPDPPQRQPRAEAPLSAEADFRRACRRARHVGARRRLGRRLACAAAPRRRATATSSTARRCGSPTAPARDVLVVYAKTDPAAGARGITAFIVEKGFKGFRVGAEARQARHARLGDRRARVRGLRSAGGERARPSRARASTC